MSFENFANAARKIKTPHAPSAFGKGKQPGDTVDGIIVDADAVDATKFNSDEPRLDRNGDPLQRAVITLEGAPDPNDPYSDGKTTVYVDMWGAQWQWLNDAAKKGGFNDAIEAIVPGTYMTVTFKGQEQDRGPYGVFTRNVFEYTLTPAPENTPDSAPHATGTRAPQSDTQPTPQAPTTPGQAQTMDKEEWGKVQSLLNAGVTPQVISDTLHIPIEQISQ